MFEKASVGSHVSGFELCFSIGCDSVLPLPAALASWESYEAEPVPDNRDPVCLIYDRLRGGFVFGNVEDKYGEVAIQPGPILKPKGPNFTTIESVKNGLKFVSNGVDGKGRKTHGEYTATFDGTDSFYAQIIDGQADPDSAPSTVSLKKIDDHALELAFKVGGRVVLITKLVVSPDGKTGTATSTGFNADGSTSISTVSYDKQ
jgi:hypothetical protein